MITEKCPCCGNKLHKGQHKFSDGMFNIIYCKDCGYRNETKA
jgi:C4-type Zn-finger protein